MRFGKHLLGSVLLLGPSVPSAALQEVRSPFGTEVYQLTRNGGGLGCDLQETDIFARRQSGLSVTWTVERLRTNMCWHAGRDSVHAWISSDSCPPLDAIMQKLPQAAVASRAAQNPAVAPPTETPLTKLQTFPNAWSAAGVESEYDGPLVRWWLDAEKTLASCWTDHPPRSR